MNIVFLIYKNRSGSTFLLNKLNHFNEICPIPELGHSLNYLLNEPSKLYREHDSYYKEIQNQINDPNSKINSLKLPLNEFINNKYESNYHLFRNLLKSYKEKIKPTAHIIILKHPKLNDIIINNYKYYIHKNIKIIYLLRDPRAIFASAKKSKQSSNNNYMEINPVSSAKDWILHYESRQRIKNIFKDDCLELNYEYLISDFEKQLSIIREFLGIKSSYSNNNDSDFLDQIPNAQKHLHLNIDKTPLKSRIDNYKNELNKSEIIVIEKVCDKYIAKDEGIHKGKKFYATILYYFYIYSDYLHKIKRKIEKFFKYLL